MKTIEAVVTKPVYDFQEGEVVKILSFQHDPIEHRYGVAGAYAIVARKNGSLSSIEINLLIVNPNTI